MMNGVISLPLLASYPSCCQGDEINAYCVCAHVSGQLRTKCSSVFFVVIVFDILYGVTVKK